jgi:hypothetical protein
MLSDVFPSFSADEYNEPYESHSALFPPLCIESCIPHQTHLGTAMDCD